MEQGTEISQEQKKKGLRRVMLDFIERVRRVVSGTTGEDLDSNHEPFRNHWQDYQDIPVEEIDQIRKYLQHPIFRDSTNAIDYLLENYVTSQELERLIVYFENESQLPVSLTQVQYGLTEVQKSLEVDDFVNSFEQHTADLETNLNAFRKNRPNYQDTSVEELYQIHKHFQHTVFRYSSDTISRLLSNSVSSQELEALIARFEDEPYLPISSIQAFTALNEERGEILLSNHLENIIGFFEQNIHRFKRVAPIETYVIDDQLFFDDYYVGTFRIDELDSPRYMIGEAIDQLKLSSTANPESELCLKNLTNELGYNPKEVYERLYLGKVTISATQRENIIGFFEQNIHRFERVVSMDYLLDPYDYLYFDNYYVGTIGMDELDSPQDNVSHAIQMIEWTNEGGGNWTDNSEFDLTLEVLENKLGYDSNQVYTRLYLGDEKQEIKEANQELIEEKAPEVFLVKDGLDKKRNLHSMIGEAKREAQLENNYKEIKSMNKEREL